MATPDPHKIPKGLDRPVPILLWEPNEVIGVVLLLGVGVVLKVIVLGIAGAIAVMVYSNKVRRRGKRGQGPHVLWRLGICFDKGLIRHAPRPYKVDFYR